MASFIYFVEPLARIGRRASGEEVKQRFETEREETAKFRNDQELQKEFVIVCSSNRVKLFNLIAI